MSAPAAERSASSRRGWPPVRLGRRSSATILAIALGGSLFVAGTGYRYAPLSTGLESASSASPSTPAGEVGRTPAELARLTPSGVYIVIDRANNHLYLKRGEEILLAAPCSSGSGSLLRDPAGNRQWVFDTPSGVFRVRSKQVNPVWRKPDWAFIELGQPVPANPGLRIEYGVLGEYALDLGDGYLIHGTLYERLLGRSVTHGCIRLGRDDLRRVYHSARLGTPVYIF